MQYCMSFVRVSLVVVVFNVVQMGCDLMGSDRYDLESLIWKDCSLYIYFLYIEVLKTMMLFFNRNVIKPSLQVGIAWLKECKCRIPWFSALRKVVDITYLEKHFRVSPQDVWLLDLSGKLQHLDESESDMGDPTTPTVDGGQHRSKQGNIRETSQHHLHPESSNSRNISESRRRS